MSTKARPGYHSPWGKAGGGGAGSRSWVHVDGQLTVYSKDVRLLLSTESTRQQALLAVQHRSWRIDTCQAGRVPELTQK